MPFKWRTPEAPEDSSGRRPSRGPCACRASAKKAFEFFIIPWYFLSEKDLSVLKLGKMRRLSAEKRARSRRSHMESKQSDRKLLSGLFFRLLPYQVLLIVII